MYSHFALTAFVSLPSPMPRNWHNLNPRITLEISIMKLLFFPELFPCYYCKPLWQCLLLHSGTQCLCKWQFRQPWDQCPWPQTTVISLYTPIFHSLGLCSFPYIKYPLSDQKFHPLSSLPPFLTLTLWSLWSLGELFPLLQESHFPAPQPHPKISWCPTSTSVFSAFDSTTHVHLNLNNGSLTTIYIFWFYIWVVMQLPKPKQPWRLMPP